MNYAAITKKIIGCAFKVHNTLGNGFQEVIYQRAMEIEFSKNHLDFSREFEMPVFYEDIQIGTRRVDFLVSGIISVELLINFGAKSLEYKRLTNKKHPDYDPVSLSSDHPLNPGSDK